MLSDLWIHLSWKLGRDRLLHQRYLTHRLLSLWSLERWKKSHLWTLHHLLLLVLLLRGTSKWILLSNGTSSKIILILWSFERILHFSSWRRSLGDKLLWKCLISVLVFYLVCWIWPYNRWLLKRNLSLWSPLLFLFLLSLQFRREVVVSILFKLIIISTSIINLPLFILTHDCHEVVLPIVFS